MSRKPPAAPLGLPREEPDGPQAAESRRLALTLLFTDVVGSTAMASALGDAEWSPRLQQHKAMLRQVVDRFGGRVRDETGDGVFAAFPSTSQALYAAALIVSYSLMSAGQLPVRVGVHSGEVEVTDSHIMGVAVHVAARVMSLASESEVMVSRTSVEQVRGASFTFHEGGEHVLKGFEGTWQLFRLDVESALARLPSSMSLPSSLPKAAAAHEPRPEPQHTRLSSAALPGRRGEDRGVAAPRPRRQVGRIAVVGSLLALLAAGGVAVAVNTQSEDPSPASAFTPEQDQPDGGPPSAEGSTEWTTLRPMALARQQVQAVLTPGAIVTAGGLTHTGSTRSVEVYDPAIDRWQSGPELPVPLHHAAMTTWNTKATIIGGWEPKGTRLTASTSDRVLVLTEDGWVDMPHLLRPRAAHAATRVGNVIVVAGGQSPAGELEPTTEVFDGSTWRDAAPMPTPRDHLAMVTDGRYAYAIGGRKLSAKDNLNTLERYDPATDTWEALPAMPTARGGITAVRVGTRIVVTGGETTTGVLGRTEVYDIEKRAWSRLPDLREGRHGAAGTALNNSVYVLGGATAPKHVKSSQSLEVLDLPSLAP